MKNSLATPDAPPAASQASRPTPHASRRLGSRWLNRLKALFGLPAQRRLGRAALQVDRIRYWEKELGRLSDAELRKFGLRLRGRARGKEPLERLLPEAFGAVCVAAMRTVGLRPHDVQLAGGVVLHYGGLAELATGEGKTLVATFPTFLNALPGAGAHVTTVNDYLAKRDAEWTRPIYEALGLTVGLLQTHMPQEERAQAYRCDITYGTASEFGFDFLRDRLQMRGNTQKEAPFWSHWTGTAPLRRIAPAGVQRGHYFALVDEADNIFIDEARTPLVISGETRSASLAEQVVYHWADRLAQEMVRDRHFLFDEKQRRVELTEEGEQRIRWSNPPSGPHSHALDKLHEHVERAILAQHFFRRDQHYMVDKDKDQEKIIIIDEYTGRKMPDRQWGEGLHQAVEAKEKVSISLPAEHTARVTFQSYFRLYKKLAGLTGTAATNWRELRRVYKLCVVCVPTNKPVIREQWPDRVFPTEEAKFNAVVEEVARLRALGRPVLIGTRSVERSELLSRKFQEAGIEHQVLNARFHEQEAEIVAQAGQAGRVTIATNMAGRGTDIKPDPGVAKAGGLHVLGTERHEAGRIDQQLAGRTGRQGDPGSCQFFLSLEDELLEALGRGKSASSLRSPASSLFLKAQRRMERRHYRQRLNLLHYEKHRQEILKDLGADPYVD